MAAKSCADARSRVRLSADFLLSRVVGAFPRPYRDRLREVRFRNNVRICYRLNKGDLHSIREVWFEEAYRLPFDEPSGALLDLGANIGMTSVWLWRRCRFTQAVAVEPDPRNAAVLRRNLELNGVNARVVEAAIGSYQGVARFELNQASNLGSVSESSAGKNSAEVPMTTVNALMKELGIERWGLAKIDIEGGEAALLKDQTEWLDRTGAIIIELHPQHVDCDEMARAITAHHFKHIPSNSVFAGNMDSFVRLQNT